MQERFTRLFPDLRTLPYRDRLRRLGLLSLRARRLRYQLILMYKIMNNLVDVNANSYFCRSDSRMPIRGNPVKIVPHGLVETTEGFSLQSMLYSIGTA